MIKYAKVNSVIFYIHGASWVFGSFHTHEKTISENLIVLKLIDGVLANITVGMQSLCLRFSKEGLAMWLVLFVLSRIDWAKRIGQVLASVVMYVQVGISGIFVDKVDTR